MAIPEDLYGSLRGLQRSLQRAQLPAAPLPEATATTHQIEFWLVLQGFLFLQRFYEDPRLPARESPEEVITSTEDFAQRVNARLNLPLPPARRSGPLGLLASWFPLAGRAVGGSNWCIHDDGNRTPMDIFRHVDVPGRKELHMLCEDLHETQYHPVAGAGTSMKKLL
jgi:hypothetical protein